MDILLMKPPMRACMVEIGRHVPIGLAYLSSALRADGHRTTIFDSLSFTEDNHVVAEADLTAVEREKVARHPRWRNIVHWGAKWDRVERALREARPDVVGISCMFTPHYEPAYTLARLVKKVLPGTAVVLGGQHGTVAFHHVLDEPCVDVVVLGEAESTVGPVMAAIGERRPLENLSGVAFRCGEGWCTCVERGAPHLRPRAPFVSDLDSIRWPAADQLDFRRYADTTTLITSRGCPFSCSFCTVHATVGREFRSRTPTDVADEIEWYVTTYRVRKFLIEDDNFTFDIDRVRAICREISSRDLDVELYLPNGITVVKLSEELVADMVGAGFRGLFFGLETTDVVKLRKMRKGFTSLDKVAAGAEMFGRLGMEASASIIVGLPGQNLDDIIRDSVSVAMSGVKFWTNPFYPIPGSPDYQECLGKGIIDALTEPALFDQFNFAFGNGDVNAADHYWSWVVTQAIALWPEYFLAGPLERRIHGGDLATAADALVAASAPFLSGESIAEVPGVVTAWWPAEDGIVVRTDENGCFCGLQHVNHAVSPHATALCAFSGDVIAAAIGCRVGVAHRAEQLTSRAAGDATCTFAIRPASDGPEVPITAAFVEQIERAMEMQPARALP